jgi:hypothetical protein
MPPIAFRAIGPSNLYGRLGLNSPRIHRESVAPSMRAAMHLHSRPPGETMDRTGQRADALLRLSVPRKTKAVGLDMFLCAERFSHRQQDTEALAIALARLPVPEWVGIDFIRGTVLYWARANHIHAWMMEKCWHKGREEEINFGAAPVPIETLAVLRDTCRIVAADHGKAGELLPTCEGPRFGSLEYNERYFYEVVRTRDRLDQILATPDLRQWRFCYSPSW